MLSTASFSITGPGSGTFYTGQSVSIQWTAANVDVAGPTTITLGYDPDATVFDANQHWIEIDGVTAANGTGSYSWNTTRLNWGTYYLDGYMYDSSTSTQYLSYFTTPIVVAPPTFSLTGPTSGTFVAGQSVSIQWTAANVDVAGDTTVTLGNDKDTTPTTPTSTGSRPASLPQSRWRSGACGS